MIGYDEYVAYVATLGAQHVAPYTRAQWAQLAPVQKLGIAAAMRQQGGAR